MTTEKPIVHGLWRDCKETPEGKYLVKRRDGSVPEWPSFTLGAKDPCSPAALRAYAAEAMKVGLDIDYAKAVYRLADEFDRYREEHGNGDPDRGRHRKDDPQTVAEMKLGKSV
jgi:hypothetical protein